MDVGVIGTGSVGSALAACFAAAGHGVVVGSRDPGAVEFDDRGEIDVGGQREAAERSEVVVLAVPAGVVTGVAADLADALAGKPVIDPANEYPTPGADRPLAERVSEAAPDARVVKAFNTIGAEHMTDPVLDGETATMFVAGDDDAAVDAARELTADLGFEPVVAGGLDSAEHLEHLARFWIHLAREGGRDIAFRLLRG